MCETDNPNAKGDVVGAEEERKIKGKHVNQAVRV